MHDTVWFEIQGLPAISIASSEFREAAEAQRDALGMKEARYLLVEHPIQDATDDEMRAKARANCCEGADAEEFLGERERIDGGKREVRPQRDAGVRRPDHLRVSVARKHRAPTHREVEELAAERIVKHDARAPIEHAGEVLGQVELAIGTCWKGAEGSSRDRIGGQGSGWRGVGAPVRREHRRGTGGRHGRRLQPPARARNWPTGAARSSRTA